MSLIPWTTPRSWITGEVLTAALLNLHLRDNLLITGEPPRARVRLTTTLTIAGGVTVDVAAVTVDEDTATAVNGTNGTFTVPAGSGGLYLFSLTWATANASGTNGAANAFLNVNGTDRATPMVGAPAYVTSSVTVSVARLLRLVAGDIIKVRAQGVGTSSSVSGVSSGAETGWQIVRVAA